MKIWKIALYVVVTVAFASCASYTPAPSNTIKVLAVTAKGDTIQLDVNSLRPRVYQNIYHSYPYYYSYWNRNPYYNWNNNYNYYVPVVRPNNRPGNSNSSQSGSGPNTSSPAVIKPSTSINKPATNNNQNKGNGSTGNRRIN
tara:strand:- start:2578 stop:3003 length:426 start_codon:yes stop_codon:yes gene_type:complete